MQTILQPSVGHVTGHKSYPKKAPGSLLLLPNELLLALFQLLDFQRLDALSRTCRHIRGLMESSGWNDYCRANYWATSSDSGRWSSLSWRGRAREASLINEAWSSQKFVAKPLNNRWYSKYQPVLALSPKRLVVAAGSTITVYAFHFDTYRRQSSIVKEGTHTIYRTAPGFDITNVEFLPDGGRYETLLVSNHSGTLERIRLSKGTNANPAPINGRTSTADNLQVKTTAKYSIATGNLRVLRVAGNLAVAVSADGEAAVVNTASPWLAPSTCSIGKKAWSAYIETRGSSPFVAIGTEANVAIYPFREQGLTAEPSAILGGPRGPTPVYCVGTFMSGGNPNVLASGWYDGKVRVHDLRSSRRASSAEDSSDSAAPPPLSALASVMTFSDPWRSFDAVYSLASRGTTTTAADGESGSPHHGHFLTAGSALHSVVCLWDVRRPDRSWSAFAPGGDMSPVYDLKAEGSRVWGVTQWRAFVLDFSPGAKRTSFPPVHDAGASVLPTYVHSSLWSKGRV